MKRKLKSINNIPFLVCLTILLLNDFHLKAEYHNWLTGKLSDFCGLFVFVSFWTALFPNRKLAVYFSTGLFFVIWKSPYSQLFIDVSQNAYPIYRVVDVTDLITLLSLPIAFFYRSEDAMKLKVNPIPLAILTFISFCATSVPQPTQNFSQPQYVLFKSGIVNFEANDYPSNYQVYRFDSLVVISIKEIEIDKHAAIDDEFHKIQILGEIDLRLLRDSQEQYRKKSNLSDYLVLRDSLIVNGKTSINLKLDSVIDELNFNGTKLDGNFKRSNNDKLLIEGKYKNGIEDSVWTFYNKKGEIISRKHFQSGELIKTQRFENSILMVDQNHNTRADTIRNKYFHLAIISLLIIMLLTKLVLNYRKSEQKNIIQLSTFSSIAGIFLLPLAVLILAKSIATLIPHSYPTFFGIFFEVFWVYIVTAPLFLIVFYFLKLRSKFDWIFYLLLFSLSVVLIEEWIYLKTILN